MKKRIILNDQGLYVDCILENDRISFEFEKGLESLNDKVKLYKDGDITYALLGLKRFIRIHKDKISKVMNITTTEIRILCAIANRIDNLTFNKESNKSLVGEFYNIIKELYSLPKGWNDVQKHHSELHTHFTEILNAEEFVNFVNKYNITYPINKNGMLDFNSNTFLTYDEIVKLGYKDNIINALRLDITKQSSFDDLTHVVNNNRRELLKRIVRNNSSSIIKNHENEEYQELENNIKELLSALDEIDSSNLSKKEKDKNRKKINVLLNKTRARRDNILKDILYDDLLVSSISKLKKEKIEYTEISFSNVNRLKYLSEMHKHDDSFNMLLSIRREDDISRFQKSSEELESLLSTSKVIGVDIMGHENELASNELENFKSKIMWLLPVLHIHPNSLLRIHASEFKDTQDNMLQTLRIIDEVSMELNDACSDLFGREWGIIPPPRIRIGHGVNINKNRELIRLIKKYDVVVEINASSNYALGNIDSIDEIPLGFYKENNIKYVISTDGGGVYSTSIHQEENLLKEKEDEESSKKNEHEQIDLGRKGTGHVNDNDRSLFEKLKPVIKEKVKRKDYNSFIEALDDEDAIRNGKSPQEFVLFEIQNLSSYIMDLDPNYDSNYYRKMIDIILDLNNNNSETAKIFLFLLERELFSERETSFKTLHYLSKISNIDRDNKNNYDKDMELNIIKNNELKFLELFNMVKEIYSYKKKEITDYNDEVKRR